MAGKEIVQLVMLLYDVCKDVLSHLFETRCLDGSLTNKTLQTYVETHKNKLREHFRKNHCHNCENRNTCIDLTKEAFHSFSITKVKSTERDQMHVNDLQVWNLQYLLLAGDLNNEEHKLIVSLHNQRNNISKRLTLQLDIDESQFNETWDTSTTYIIDIYRSINDTSVETVLSKMFEYVKRSNHTMCYAEEVWCNLEAEFGNKDPYPFDVSTEERANKRKSDMHQTHGIVQIGNNNTVIEEGFSIQQMEILAKYFQETKNDMGCIIAKLNSHEKGIILTTITNEKERDSQCLRLEIDNDGVLKSDDQLESIKRLENTTLNSNDEPIEILKVYKGSIVIEAKVKFCTTDVTLLMKTVKQILHHVMGICQIPTQTAFVLKVGIKVGPPYKGAFSQSSQSNTCVKCKVNRFEKKGIENRLSDAGNKYGSMFSTPKVQQTQPEDLENRAGYESINKGEIHIFDQAVKVEMICDYEHYADNDAVAKLKKGDIYYILKEIGNWLEISDGKGGSFFILSEYCKRDAHRHIDPYTHVDKNQQTVAPTQVKRIMVKPTEKSSMEGDVEVFVEGRLIQSVIQSRALPKVRKDTLSETLSSSSETLQVTNHPVSRSVSSPDIIHMRDCAAEDSGETKEKSQARLGRKRPKKGSYFKSDGKTNIKNEPSKLSATFRAIVSKLERLLSWGTRPKRDDLVSEGRIMSTLFGSHLVDVCRRDTDKLNVPLFVKECIAAIEKRGLNSTNMYEQSNKRAQVVSLRNKIEQDEYDLDSASYKIQDLTGILLLFFEELKEPLLPGHLSKILKLNESQRTAELKRLLDELPVQNSDTLGYFCRHLKRVLEHGQENGTTVQSIVEMVAPSLMYTVDTGMRYSKRLSKCEAVSPSTASDILSICLVEYEHIFVETST